MPEDLGEEVIAYFDKNHGPVDARASIEIVPSTWPPIAIHAIQPGKGREYLTLFTTGMSSQAMTVPEGNDDFRFAELFIQLPADWPFGQDESIHPDIVWLMQWLRNVAAHVHENETWLGGPVTIFAAADPPEPLAPHVKFTSLLLLAKEHFVSKDGRTVQLYHVMPLHTEERALEMQRGIASLMRALDRHNVSFVVDLNRPPVDTSVGWYVAPLGCMAGSFFLLIPILLLLWIWIPGMGWASLAAFILLVATVILLLRFPD